MKNYKFINFSSQNISTENKSQNEFFFRFDQEIKFQINNYKIKGAIICSYDRKINFSEKNDNVLGTKKIIDFCNINKIKVIYISSVAAHEKNNSNYGKTKLYIEDLISHKCLILKPSLLVGKNFKDDLTIFKQFNKFLPFLSIYLSNIFLYECDIDKFIRIILFKLDNYNTGEKLIISNKKKLYFFDLSKKRIKIPINPYLIFYSIKLLEKMLAINLKSDSILSLINHLDLSNTNKKILFLDNSSL